MKVIRTLLSCVFFLLPQQSIKEGEGDLNRNKDHATAAEVSYCDPIPCTTGYPKPSHECLKTSKDGHEAASKKASMTFQGPSSTLPQNVLGLDYSSSSDDDRESTS